MLGGSSISRASFINFLEAMKDMGVLDAEERTGKDSQHFVYKMGTDEAGFKQYVAETLLESLMRDIPEETKIAVSRFAL